MTLHRVWLGLWLVVAVGCQSQAPTSPNKIVSSSADEGSKPVDVTLALNWYPEAEHGGFYAALVHGYFKEEGLNVTIRPGGLNVPVIPDVATKVVDFGVDNADKLLLLRAQGADVVAVMSPIQDSPRCIMVHKKSGFTRLEDLQNAKPFTLGINAPNPFAQFLTKTLNLKHVQIVPNPKGVADFLERSEFGQQAYSFSEPFLAEKLGGDPQCLMLSDIGFNTYTSALLTRRDLIDKQPDLVAKMTRASIKGWKKYLSEPDETNTYIHSKNQEMGLDVLAFGTKALRPLCLPDGFDEKNLGQMTAERWQTLVSQMVDIGQIKQNADKPLKAEDAFTLSFLKSE